ncbi:ankyrin repeat domain-containing protein [Streptomyces sp. NPDC101150]|uniref:ankyrin repeat domain-containing protein n=1 Tax=Streptomyces sp. NPDC101150 TaxID=3366114 RepID=UPI00380C0116
MNFFDGPTAGDPSPEPPAGAMALSAYAPGEDEDFPPDHWFVPAQLPQVAQVGAGPYVRIMLTGWEVWPGSVTMRLGIFLRRIRPRDPSYDDGPGAGGLRVGLSLGDGRKVTTLDGDAPSPAGGPARPTLRLISGTGGSFHYQLELHLSQLPPAGPARLVVAWPDERVPETGTDIDAAALRAAAGDALEIWPDAEPPAPAAAGAEPGGFLTGSLGPYDILAQPREADPSEEGGPAREGGPSGEEGPPPSDRPRGDWEGMARNDWRDAELVRARLAAGADPAATGLDSHATPLHLAAAGSPPEIVAELIARVPDVDARDSEGRTALWKAVTRGAEANAALLLAAGADAWSPQIGGRSPGRLALTTAMAPLFAGLPGVVPLTAAERAAQQEADDRMAAFKDVDTFGLAVAFVPGIDEEEAIRRLGDDPRNCPAPGPDADPGPYGTGPDGFDPYDFDEAERQVGVTGVAGGCVLVQLSSYLLSMGSVLDALSLGTAAYGVFFNPKGGTFGTFSRDGRTELSEEIGLPTHGADSSDAHWLYRFWDWGLPKDMHGAPVLAYASAMAGLPVTDVPPVDGLPRRWVEIPEGSPLLS